MSNLLGRAMNLLGGSDVSGAPEQGRLVGKSFQVEGTRYNVRTQIAQGGFATVYTCQDAASGTWYALKSQLANDSAAVKVIQDELRLLKESSHPHIIKYVASVMSREANGAREFLMITELCSGGSAIDLLTAGNPLTLAQVANITHGATAAIAYLHSRAVPVTHRDMKVENLLFSSRGTVKLCDFGSATSEEFTPDLDWSPARRTQLEEDFQRATTPMYRAPEILDTYLGYPVGRLQDVWALGCVLFYLCYRTHPFEDSAKLRIIYAKYSIPEDDQRYAPFRPLIECTLKPDPRERPSAAELKQRIEVLAVALEVRVDTAVPGIDTTSLTGGEPVEKTTEGGKGGGERRERLEEGGQQQVNATAGGGQASTTFSQLRGTGLSMFRNLKEKSNAVIQTVQATYGSTGPKLTWLTSRIVVAPNVLEGIPEALAVQAEDTMRGALTALRRPFKIINLAQRRLRCEYLEAVSDVTFPADGPGGQTPSMDLLLSVAHAAGIYLRQQPSEAFVVLLGSEGHTSLAALSLLVYHRVVPKPWAAIELLQEKRDSPLLLPPSAHRLLDGLHKSVQPGFAQSVSSDARVMLIQLVIDNLPTFNNQRTGCRPQLMVYVNGTSLWVPATYEMTRAYEGPVERARAQFGLKKSLAAGDVCVALFHARMSTLTQRMHQIPMISFNLHTALIDKNSNSLELRKGDLDFSPAEEQYIPEDIRISLTFTHHAGSGTRLPPGPPGAPRGYYDYPAEIVAARHVVGSPAELAEIQARFDGAARKPQRPPAPSASPEESQPQPQPQASGGFFDSLAWDAAPAAPVAAAAAAAPPPPPHRTTSKAPEAPVVAERLESMTLDPHETPILGRQSSPNNRSLADVRAEEEEVDLLGIGSSAPRPSAAATSNLLFDPFDTAGSAQTSSTPQTLDDLFGGPALSSSSNSLNKPNPVRDPLEDIFGSGGGGGLPGGGAPPGGRMNGTDLLMGDLLGASSSMHRNASAPSFPGAKKEEKRTGGGSSFDPFADFMAANPAPASSAASTRSSTPSMGGQQASRPNYSRSAFDSINATGMPAKPKSSANAFDDLLQSQGFSSSSTGNGNKTMGDMRRADEIRDLTPEQIKIRDWTAGKERNIRALLASLSDVLWEDAPRWEQPSMASLLTPNEVKKYFRKAAIVVHPDKQTGLPHAELAKAIMIELNDAWSSFEQAGSPSLA